MPLKTSLLCITWTKRQPKNALTGGVTIQNALFDLVHKYKTIQDQPVLGGAIPVFGL